MEKIINRLRSSDAQFSQQLERLVSSRAPGSDAGVTDVVNQIIDAIRKEGDAALVRYTNRLDDRTVLKPQELKVEFKGLDESISEELWDALAISAKRIRAFHERQKDGSWEFTDDSGIVLGQKITALDSVGIYVPGGTASYPSSVLMTAIPAKVAGVKEIIMVVPATKGVLSKSVLVAAAISGVTQVFSVGGAQAIASLAFGTETIPRVDKIVGPGNLFVAEAKKKLFGTVGVDMIAGPSEILIICDGKANPEWVAMDLLAQAEHDENAQAILIATESYFLEEVEKNLLRFVKTLPRSDIILSSLKSHGALIKVKNLEEAIDIANLVAPEHLELSVENPRNYLSKIRHAGAIFLGGHTPESFGDYCAGPNHVLPTSGNARFSSALGVADFQKRTSIIECQAKNASKMGFVAAEVAKAEGLTAHARSALMRIDTK